MIQMIVTFSSFDDFPIDISPAYQSILAFHGEEVANIFTYEQIIPEDNDVSSKHDDVALGAQRRYQPSRGDRVHVKAGDTITPKKVSP